MLGPPDRPTNRKLRTTLPDDAALRPHECEKAGRQASLLADPTEQVVLLGVLVEGVEVLLEVLVEVLEKAAMVVSESRLVRRASSHAGAQSRSASRVR